MVGEEQKNNKQKKNKKKNKTTKANRNFGLYISHCPFSEPFFICDSRGIQNILFNVYIAEFIIGVCMGKEIQFSCETQQGLMF